MAPEVVDKGFLLTSLRHFIDGLELDFARYAAELTRASNGPSRRPSPSP